MNPKGELIALNLTNILNTDSEVNLLSSATGVNNSAFGFYALLNNTTGTGNSAFGKDSLKFNTINYLTSLSAFNLYI